MSHSKLAFLQPLHRVTTNIAGKRNTSLAFFTSHERNELKGSWGSQSTRLTGDSFLPFGSCQLCLLSARDPVSCPSHGHLFCRECAVSNLLAQNKELKRLKKEAGRRKVEDEEEKHVEHAEAKLKAVEEFERVQAGISVRSGGRAGEKIVGKQNGKITVEQDVNDGSKGVKRKFEVDEDKEEDRTKRRVSAREDGQDDLPSFWVPSKIPDNQKADSKAIKQHPTCPASTSEQPHDFTLKSLVTIHFTEEKSSNQSDNSARTCPSCDKVLSNSTKAIVAKPCGHVLCKPCSDKFQSPPEKSALDTEDHQTVRCYVCQEDVTPSRKTKRKRDENGDGKETETEAEGKIERGLVELSSEGTGFAGGGKNMVKKQGLAFQC